MARSLLSTSNKERLSTLGRGVDHHRHRCKQKIFVLTVMPKKKFEQSPCFPRIVSWCYRRLVIEGMIIAFELPLRNDPSC